MTHEIPTNEIESDIEDNNEIIETKNILEHLIVKGDEIGEGNNGVVFKLDMSQVSFYEEEHITKEKWGRDLKDVIGLRDDMIEEIVENPSAGKILKVYRQGKAIAEFNAQTKIYEMTKNLDEKEYAKVPRTYFSFTLELASDDVQNKVKPYGVNSESLEMFLMEYINGIELKEYIYRKVIDNCPEFFYLKEADNYKDKKQIYKEIDSYLGILSNIDLTSKSQLNIITDFLKKNNIKIEIEILDKIEKTTNYLNDEKSIFHNDLNMKNFLIIKKTDGSFGVYIIDFEKADTKPKLGAIRDYEIVNALRKL